MSLDALVGTWRLVSLAAQDAAGCLPEFGIPGPGARHTNDLSNADTHGKKLALVARFKGFNGRGSNEMEIERLTQVDLPLAHELNRLFDEGKTWDEEQGRLFLQNPDNLFLLARWSGAPCGFLTAHRLQRFDRRRAGVLLYEIGVGDGFRRRGIGTALINSVKRWASNVGADEVWVLTDRGNTAAIALYEGAGGEDGADGTIMFTYQITTKP
jgi:ribosomal protein S18 acetylase RimI-like enzyme